MIQSFTVVNHKGESIFMDIRKPEDTGFLISSVTGITPPESDVSSTEYALHDGSDLGNIRVTDREIVFTIIFYQDNNKNESVEQLRWKLYQYFPLKKKITIKVTNEHGTYSIDGYVKIIDCDIFTSQEGATITINCPDPYFRKDEETSLYLFTVVPEFEFPVCFEPTEEFGDIKTFPETDIVYNGDADTGITLRIESLGDVTNPLIYNLSDHTFIGIDSKKLTSKTGYGIKRGDILTITTTRGNKSVSLYRDGKTVNLLSALKSGSSWFSLTPGSNRFYYGADSGSYNLRVNISYITKYYGV